MLRMDQVHVILHKVLIEGRRVRAVARELSVSRNTVRLSRYHCSHKRVGVAQRLAEATLRVESAPSGKNPTILSVALQNLEYKLTYGISYRKKFS